VTSPAQEWIGRRLGAGPGGSAQGEERFEVVGKAMPRVDAVAKVTGATRYADDLHLPKSLFCVLLRSPHPHARINAIDISKAKALPGVVAVLTGEALPIRFGPLPVSQDEEVLAAEKVRYVGDPVAAVAAIDEATARGACKLIEVDYQPLARVDSIEAALEVPSDEPIHADAESANIHRMAALEFGDVDAGFALADVVREDVFFYEGSNHLAMEEHSATAVFSDGQLTLWSSTQAPHNVHRVLSKVLELPMGHIRVVATPHGGGFGGKVDPFAHEIVVSKLAMMTGRPVKCTLSREEVFYNHRGRHPVLMWIRTGATEDGRITAMHFRSALDGGAYGSLGVATMYYTGALQPATYDLPAYRFEGCRVFTNKAPCGPKRGHGTPQPRFAIELHLDKLAQDLNMDPVELRRRNYVKPGSRTANWLRITSCGIEEVTDKVLEASGFATRRRRVGHGQGFAVSAYLCGAGFPMYMNRMPHSEVNLKVDRGGVTVFCGATDIGQGSDSVLATLVAEELGLSRQDVRLVTGDTGLTPVDLGSYSSRVTFMAGNAAIDAARKIRKLLVQAVASRSGKAPEEVFVGNGKVGELSFEQAVVAAEEDNGALSASGSYAPPADIAGRFRGSGVGPSPAFSYTAAVADVDVDVRTGEVRVGKVWIAHDIGRVLNPTLVRGQVDGSVYMGLAEALMEEQSYRKGLHHHPSVLEYKTPLAPDMPEIETVIVETIDPEGPYGAKEVGQGPMLPVVPAIVSAIHDAVGVWIDEVPVTPDKVLRALDAKAKGKQGRVGPPRFPEIPYPPYTKVALPDAATAAL
jgi:4-hydroxybenzoyl-CoA reductase subunit alpha